MIVLISLFFGRISCIRVNLFTFLEEGYETVLICLHFSNNNTRLKKEELLPIDGNFDVTLQTKQATHFR